MEYLHNLWDVFGELSLWLLLGCFVSGLMYVFIPQSWLRRHLSGNSFLSILKSVVVGVPMPLCSCGVIPAALGLKKQGAGDGASMGFLISTPQTGVDSIFVSASMLSWPFAIFKLISAFILGLIGGVVSSRLSGEVEVDIDADEVPTPEKSFKSIYDFAVNELLYSIWRWILVGVLVSAAITTWVPAEVVKDWTSHSLLLTLFSVLLISVPLYVCATSSVPIAAALVHAGMPLSAALVFLMAGPATNVATIGAVYKSFGLRHLINYLLTIILGSVGLAYCFDFLLDGSVHGAMDHSHASGSIFSFVLILLFLSFLLKDARGYFSRKNNDDDGGYEELRIEVGGLTCQVCVNKLTSAFSSLEGCKIQSVDIETGVVVLQIKPGVRGKVEEFVKKTGFVFKKFIN